MKAKDSVLTIKIEKELRDAFMAAAAAEDRPASSILRELMRDYLIEQRRVVHKDAAEHRVAS